MEIVDRRGGLGEQRRVAEIPLRHFPLTAGKKGCVDVQFEVQLEALRGRVVTNGAEDPHECLCG